MVHDAGSEGADMQLAARPLGGFDVLSIPRWLEAGQGRCSPSHEAKAQWEEPNVAAAPAVAVGWPKD